MMPLPFVLLSGSSHRDSRLPLAKWDLKLTDLERRSWQTAEDPTKPLETKRIQPKRGVEDRRYCQAMKTECQSYAHAGEKEDFEAEFRDDEHGS